MEEYDVAGSQERVLKLQLGVLAEKVQGDRALTIGVTME